MSTHPTLLQVVLDCVEPRPLAEFYRQLLGYDWRPGCETPIDGEDWLVIVSSDTGQRIAFQKVDSLTPTTWPDPTIPQQSHLDTMVNNAEEFVAAHRLSLRLGAKVLLDRSDDGEEPLRVYADPAGHPYCIFYWAGPTE